MVQHNVIGNMHWSFGITVVAPADLLPEKEAHLDFRAFARHQRFAYLYPGQTATFSNEKTFQSNLIV